MSTARARSCRDPILVVEDHRGLREMLVEALTGEGHPVVAAADVGAARAHIGASPLAFVLTDLKLPDGSGLEVVAAAREAAVPVVVLTAYGNVGDAVEAMKLGAIDFLEKPVELDRLFAVLAARLVPPEKDSAPFRAPGGPELVGTTPIFRAALRLLERAAATDATVLLLGESGTGKELFARSLHLLSARRDRPFVAVNCAAIPAALVESELFGHEKGSFTGAHQRQLGRFESAAGGTLFLDEVGELPLEIQAKVLRAVEEKVIERVGGSKPLAIDLRLVTATNRDLEAMVAAGTFRADLYYRLAIFPIHLPALRDRPEDIACLARHLLDRAAERHQSKARTFSPATLEWLCTHNWPGNVRELANTIERAAILSEGELVEIGDLPGSRDRGPGNGERGVGTRDQGPGTGDRGAGTERGAGSAASTAASTERERVAAALEENGGDHQLTAAALGISYRTLLRRLDALDLRGSRWR